MNLTENNLSTMKGCETPNTTNNSPRVYNGSPKLSLYKITQQEMETEQEEGKRVTGGTNSSKPVPTSNSFTPNELSVLPEISKLEIQNEARLDLPRAADLRVK